MKRTPLKRKSDKRKALEKSVAHARKYLREEGDCEACGHSPSNPWPDKPMQCSVLTVHEICRGNGLRHKALDKRHSTLRLCQWCNCIDFDDARRWPECKQLALLLAVRPQDFDLQAHNRLVRERAPNRILQSEVDAYRDEIEQLTGGRS